jgi:hypothetical protein
MAFSTAFALVERIAHRIADIVSGIAHFVADVIRRIVDLIAGVFGRTFDLVAGIIGCVADLIADIIVALRPCSQRRTSCGLWFRFGLGGCRSLGGPIAVVRRVLLLQAELTADRSDRILAAADPVVPSERRASHGTQRESGNK